MAENPSTTNPVLKRCPFCGGPALLHSYHEAEGRSGINRVHWVTCDISKPGHCQAAVGIPVNNRQSEAAAIAAWNRRAGADADLLEELKHCGMALEKVANLIRPNFSHGAALLDVAVKRVSDVIAKTEGQSNG